MTDIIERLRAPPRMEDGIPAGECYGCYDKQRHEAANEIERLYITLIDIDELVEEYADANDGQPNLAMKIMTMVRAILEKSPPT